MVLLKRYFEMRKFTSLMTTGAAIAFVATAFSSSAEAQWGTLKGNIVLKGEMPVLKPLVVKGDMTAKDPAICAAEGVADEKLVVDPATKGIANILVFLAKKPEAIHPDLVASKEKELKFDQKGCKFLPHVMVVRTDQQVRVLSDDETAHNTHTNPLRNGPDNLIINRNRSGVLLKPLKVVEKTPVKINCDIHNYMFAYWLVVDHPYAAVTDEKGNYEISNLPVGDHEFTIWQESSGWLNKKYAVSIKEGVNEQKPLEFTADQILK